VTRRGRKGRDDEASEPRPRPGSRGRQHRLRLEPVDRHYTEITGGTQLTTSCDDTNYAANAIPFTFTFNGTAYTQFSVNCNGFIAMAHRHELLHPISATANSTSSPLSAVTSRPTPSTATFATRRWARRQPGPGHSVEEFATTAPPATFTTTRSALRDQQLVEVV